MGWGTVSQSMKYAYPDWTDSDIGLLGNWGEIMFLVTSVPATWIVETKGARCLQLLYRDCHTVPILLGLEDWSALPSSCWARGSGVSSGCSKIIRTLGSFSKFLPTQVRDTGTRHTLIT